MQFIQHSVPLYRRQSSIAVEWSCFEIKCKSIHVRQMLRVIFPAS